MHLLRIKSVVSPSRGTSDRRRYGASTAHTRLRYDPDIVEVQDMFFAGFLCFLLKHILQWNNFVLARGMRKVDKLRVDKETRCHSVQKRCSALVSSLTCSFSCQSNPIINSQVLLHMSSQSPQTQSVMYKKCDYRLCRQNRRIRAFLFQHILHEFQKDRDLSFRESIF